MKIREIQVWKEDLGLKRPYTIAGATMSTSENVFIQIILEKGTAGIGSASPSERVCHESMEQCVTALQSAGDILLNQDLRHFVSLKTRIQSQLDGTPAACAAADIALFDVFCKALDVRIVDFLGRKVEALPTSVTIGIKDLAEVREDLEKYLTEGFTCVKVKIGTDTGHDIAVIRKMREWGGSGFKIRVDGNEGYSPQDMQTFLQGTLTCGVELIEQPFPAPAVEVMRRLDPSTVAQCMADEDLKTRENALDLIGSPLPYGMWNIKLMKSGGISGGKWIADLANLRSIPVMWGCMDESRVSIAAALHVAYASRNTQYLDLDGSFDLSRDIVSGGFVCRDGMMYLTEEPGLGVKLL